MRRLALVALASSVMDFQGNPQVLELMERLGQRPGFERFLGLVKIIGALGLLVGLFEDWIGILAAAGFTLYFLLAMGAHRRIQDAPKDMAPAIGLFVLSAACLVTGLLAGTLGGAAMGKDVIDFNHDDSSVTNTGQAIAAINIEAFGEIDEFKASVDMLIRDLRGSARLPNPLSSSGSMRAGIMGSVAAPTNAASAAAARAGWHPRR